MTVSSGSVLGDPTGDPETPVGSLLSITRCDAGAGSRRDWGSATPEESRSRLRDDCLRDVMVIIDGCKDLVFTGWRRHRQQRAIGVNRAQGSLEVRGRGEVDAGPSRCSGPR